MTGAVAALPMYDWPELRAQTDRLWVALREALRAAGAAAPDALSRDLPARAVWEHPRLALAQTCGLPFVRELSGRVTLLGAPDHGVPGCPPGHYRSAVVVRAGDARDGLAAYRGARLAINGRESQSGYAALLHHAAPLAEDGRFFGAALVAGSHEAAAAAVADGRAEIAALDWVSWRLIRRFRPAAARLRVLMLTDATPALPYIAASGTAAGPHRAAIAEALDGLDAATREALGIRGFRAFDDADYAVIRERADAAEARLGL